MSIKRQNERKREVEMFKHGV